MTRKKGYPKRPPRQKGAFGTVVLWVVMLAVVGGGVAQFVGPFAGWFEPAVEGARKLIFGAPSRTPEPEIARHEPETEPGNGGQTVKTGSPAGTATEGAGETPPKTPVPPASEDPDTGPLTGIAKELTKPTAPETKPEKAAEPIDYKKLFEQYLDEELAKLQRPKPGKLYTIPTTKYDINIGREPVYKGVLMVIGNDRVVLRRSDNGESVTITPDMLNEQWQEALFPRIVARRRAVDRLDELMAKQPAETIAKADPVEPGIKPTFEMPTEPANGDDDHSVVETTRTLGFGSKLKDYDPTQAKTPRHLGKQVTRYGQWLEMQQRRVGGQIAKELYAKQQGSQVVLYVVMHPNFTRQKYEIREVTTEMMWQMWSRRCREDGKVSTMQSAHLVLLDGDRRIIGGSQVNRASDIWVQR